MAKLALYSSLIVLWVCANVSGQGVKTNNPTVAPYPHIVREVQLTGQTSPIPTTTLFTPKSNGLFRFSGVMVVTTGNQCQDNCTWTTTIGFSPGTGATTQEWLGANAAVVGGGVTPGTLTVRNNGGQPLTYSVTCSFGDCSGSVYELFMTVEQIQ